MRKGKKEKAAVWLSHARDGDGEIELRGKGKHEDIWGIHFDGGPLRGIGVRGRPGMHVEKRVAGGYAGSLADHDEISTKGELEEWRVPRSGGDGRIDASGRLAQVHLPPRGLPSLECFEPVGQG